MLATNHGTIKDAAIGGLVAGRPCLKLRPETRLDSVLNIMNHTGQRIAGIVDHDRQFQGLLTRSSLLGRLVIQPDFDVGQRIDVSELQSTTAADVMIANPVVLPSELGIQDALSVMMEYGFHTLPVVEENARLVGMAAICDLVPILQDNDRQVIRAQEDLLTYFMHHENYGVVGEGPKSENT